MQIQTDFYLTLLLEFHNLEALAFILIKITRANLKINLKFNLKTIRYKIIGLTMVAYFLLKIKLTKKNKI